MGALAFHADDGVHDGQVRFPDLRVQRLRLSVEETPGLTATTKKSHEDAKKAVRGRKALRAVHKAFALAQPRKGAGVPGDFKPRANPLVVAGPMCRARNAPKSVLPLCACKLHALKVISAPRSIF